MDERNGRSGGERDLKYMEQGPVPCYGRRDDAHNVCLQAEELASRPNNDIRDTWTQKDPGCRKGKEERSRGTFSESGVFFESIAALDLGKLTPSSAPTDHAFSPKG